MNQKFKSIATKSVAGFMALWLSGFIFLIACHAQSNAAGFCPLMKLGAHCDLAEKAKDAEKVVPQTSQEGIDCCAFIPAFFDKTRTNEGHRPLAITTLTVVVEQPKSVSIRTNFAPARIYHSKSSPKNDTFLKNRTFRI